MRAWMSGLALLVGVTAAAPAQVVVVPTGPPVQEKRIGLRAHVGMFAPVLPLVAVPPNLTSAAVELESSPLAGGEIDVRLSGLFRLYAGLTHARTRVNHSSLMETQGPPRPDSPTGLFVPTGGILLTPRLLGDGGVRPTFRLGGGVKFYDFDLFEVRNGVQDPTVELGVGLMGNSQPTTFLAEVRWLLSKFDPRFLPVRVIGAEMQTQNDLAFVVGFRFGL